MLYTITLIFFLFVCIVMTVAILLQSSKGGGLAGAFGGGANMGSVFGGRGAATFLSKATTWMAVLYLVVAFMLSKAQSGGPTPDQANQSILSQNREQIDQNPAMMLPPVEQSAPAVNVTPPDSSGGN